jgi:hypothetical protein
MGRSGTGITVSNEANEEGNLFSQKEKVSWSSPIPHASGSHKSWKFGSPEQNFFFNTDWPPVELFMQVISD